jgi:hypothetical protein
MENTDLSRISGRTHPARNFAIEKKKKKNATISSMILLLNYYQRIVGGRETFCDRTEIFSRRPIR